MEEMKEELAAQQERNKERKKERKKRRLGEKERVVASRFCGDCEAMGAMVAATTSVFLNPQQPALLCRVVQGARIMPLQRPWFVCDGRELGWLL